MSLDKSEYKDIGDAVGMPDEQDRQQIQKLIDDFEKKHPGEIKFHRDAASDHLKQLRTDVVGKKSGRRYALEIPEPLYIKMEQYIPTLFRSKKHFTWLRKNFKELFLEF